MLALRHCITHQVEFLLHDRFLEDRTLEALKTYKGNTKDFNAYTYYMNNTDLQTAIGADGDKLLKHYNDYGKTEGRKAK